MKRSHSSAVRQPFRKADGPFEVRYLDELAARPLLSRIGSILGVVGYGAQRPDYLPLTCPFVAAPLLPLIDGPMFEVWMTETPNLPCQHGPVVGARCDNLAFGAITLEEDGKASLEDTVEAAYQHIFDFLEKVGFFAPIRFWNLPNIDHG